MWAPSPQLKTTFQRANATPVLQALERLLVVVTDDPALEPRDAIGPIQLALISTGHQQLALPSRVRNTIR